MYILICRCLASVTQEDMRSIQKLVPICRITGYVTAIHKDCCFCCIGHSDTMNGGVGDVIFPE